MILTYRWLTSSNVKCQPKNQAQENLKTSAGYGFQDESYLYFAFHHLQVFIKLLQQNILSTDC